MTTEQHAATHRTGAKEETTARVGIVGLGYVGLPLALAFARAGHEVEAVDIDPGKVGSLDAGTSYIEDVSDDELRDVADQVRYQTDFSALRSVDALFICVPTPLTGNREPDLGPLEASAAAVGDILGEGQLVVLESTTYPGTTRELLVPILEKRSGLVAGESFSVAFSPERVDPGRTDFTTATTPKVVGGLTAGCLKRAAGLYASICDEVVEVSTPEAAELTKLLENIFRSVNIALVNELAMLADRMGVDIWEVVDAAATKPYGFMRFEPGPGMGGHCLPVDPFYLSWRARQFDMVTEFIELAGKVNQQMPYYCVERIVRLLNKAGLAAKGSTVGLIGVSYKAGVGDMRESPALKMIALLRGAGARVVYHDSFVPELDEAGLTGSSLATTVEESDVVVIVTAHPDVDHDELALGSTPVLDLRGATRTVPGTVTRDLL